MKAVIELVAALILLTASGYLVPKAVEEFRKETLKKIDGGISPLSSFTAKE